MNKQTDNTLVDRVADAVRALGLEVAPVRAPKGANGVAADTWLRLGKGRDGTDYLVEARRHITPATLGAVVTQMRDRAREANHPALLVTNYVTPPVAETLRARQQPFADAAGNAYLEGPGLFVYVTGRKPLATRTLAHTDKILTVNGVKIVFALLCEPGLAAAPHRTIAAAAGVALGAVTGMLGDLQDAGHLLVAGKVRRLDPTRRLLDEWAFAYARRVRPKTRVATYQTPHFAQWKHWQIDPAQLRWGGEPAANLLVRHLKPGVLTLYADRLPPRLIIEQQMVPAEPREALTYLEIRKPFWGRALQMDTRIPVVPPALVYADLLATGDARCLETAQLVYDGHLARPVPGN